jgi:tetratricopeptide (TPR) repeat protein
MVRASVDRAAPSPALVEQIVRQAEGVPLFVEELARVLRESSGRGGPGDGAADLDIPTTLRDLLTARLDGVSRAARGTAQLAAVLGREFSEDVLKAVSEKDAAAVRADIVELEDAFLVFRRRVGRGYHFRHTLLRDAAYDTLTRLHRQKLHARVADVLQERFAEVAEGRPEILALHLERAGRIGSAVDYWIRASDASFRRAAYLEVGSQADHALALVRGLPPVAENHLRAVDLLVLLGITRMSTMGWALPETEEPFVEAWEICEQLGVDAPPLALWGIWGVETTRSNRSRVEALLPRFRGFASRTDVPLLAHVGHSCLGISAFWRGDFRDADAHLGEALRLYREDDQRALAYDSGLYAHVVGATTLCLTGAARRAWQLCLAARTIAERRGDPYSLAVVLGWGSVVAHDRGDLATARVWAERLMALADEQRLAAWWAPAACALGRVHVAEGRTGEGLDLVRAGLDRYQRLGVRCSYNYYQTYLADAALRTGQDAEAAAAIEEGLVLCRELFARFHEPELWRLRGALHRRRERTGEAEADLRGALAQAEDRGALVYALRAGLDLADLLIDLGRTADAVALVQPIYDRFAEHEGADVERAAVLLRALA